MAEPIIKCPQCGTRIPLSDALKSEIEHDIRHALEASSRKELKAAIERERKTIESDLSAQLKKQSGEFEKKLLRVEAEKRKVESGIEERIRVESKKAIEEARKRAESKAQNEIDDLQEVLDQKNKELKGVRQESIRLQRLENDLKRKESQIENQIKQRVEHEKKTFEFQLSEEFKNKEQQTSKQLQDMRQQIMELKRKSEQAPQQVQGSILERELDRTLRSKFHQDVIRPVPKGVRGADCIQEVWASGGQCGTIVWESKNTKLWDKKWIRKIKNDQRQLKAELAVIVSVTLPPDIQHLGNIEGVWVCDFASAPGLAFALRQQIMEIERLRAVTGNSDENMQLLYSYITGGEFKQRIEAIVESFRAMQDALDKEKSTTEKRWLERQSQIDTIMRNIGGMYIDLQESVGKSLPKVRHLELVGPK